MFDKRISKILQQRAWCQGMGGWVGGWVNNEKCFVEAKLIRQQGKQQRIIQAQKQN